MARRIRFIPEDSALAEVTCRTEHGCFLLEPTDELRSIVIGDLTTQIEMETASRHAREAARRELVEAYGWFLGAYREVAEKLREGNIPDHRTL